MTNMYQGLIAYVSCALLCIVLLCGAHAPFSGVAHLPHAMLLIPGDSQTHYGPMYMFSLIFTGVIGSMC